MSAKMRSIAASRPGAACGVRPGVRRNGAGPMRRASPTGMSVQYRPERASLADGHQISGTCHSTHVGRMPPDSRNSFTAWRTNGIGISE